MTTKKSRITKYCKAIDDAPITLNESLVTHKAWTNEAKACIAVADKEIAKATEDLRLQIASLEETVRTLSQQKTTLIERNITQAETIRMLDRLRESAGTAVRDRDQQIEALQEKNAALKEKSKRAGLIVRGLKHEINDLQTKRVNYTTHFFGPGGKYVGIEQPRVEYPAATTTIPVTPLSTRERYEHVDDVAAADYEFALRRDGGYAPSTRRYPTYGEALDKRARALYPGEWQILRRAVGTGRWEVLA